MTADAKNYYASYDLLKVTNTVNLFVLIDQILEDSQIAPMHQITEQEFYKVLEEVWERINLMGRWQDTAAWGEEKKDDEELMWRYGEQRFFLQKMACFVSISAPDNLWTSSLFLAQKEATTRGHGAALLSFWRNSMGDYQLQHNVRHNRECNKRALKIFLVSRPTTRDRQPGVSWLRLVSTARRCGWTLFTTSWSTTKVQLNLSDCCPILLS